MSVYKGPLREVESVEEDEEGMVRALRFRGCGHRLVYRRRRRVAPEAAPCPGCLGGPRAAPGAGARPAPRNVTAAAAAAPPPASTAPASSRPRGGLRFAIPVLDPFAEAAARRQDRERMDKLRCQGLDQAEREVVTAAAELAITGCGSHAHDQALERLAKALGAANRLPGGRPLAEGRYREAHGG